MIRWLASWWMDDFNRWMYIVTFWWIEIRERESMANTTCLNTIAFEAAICFRLYFYVIGLIQTSSIRVQMCIKKCIWIRCDNKNKWIKCIHVRKRLMYVNIKGFLFNLYSSSTKYELEVLRKKTNNLKYMSKTRKHTLSDIHQIY
jgi:hypothetical protein